MATGGGIHGSQGSISLTNSTVSGNSATDSGRSGGGIFTDSGNITLTNSTVSNNNAEEYGGGIRSYNGDVTLTNSTVSGNTSTGGDGGGIRMGDGSLSLTNSTVSGNTSTTSDGGGIWSDSGNVTLTNSTVSGNTSTVNDGGGIWIFRGDLTLTNSTVSDNSADNSGGGIFANGTGRGTTFSMVNSILANSDTGGDCGGGFDTITGNNSLVEDGGTACGITGVNITSLLTVDPQLGALADNGGATLTHLPQVGSPVIEAGDNTNCGTGKTIATDQRGVARDDGMCDIGAVEGPTPPPVASVQLDSATATVSEDGSTITLNLTRSGDTVSAISVDYSTSDSTATAPADYTADTNTLNFATGITSQSVSIDITDDSNVESDEDFTLTLSNVQLVSGTASVELGANAAATVTITNDDTAPPVASVQLDSTTATVSEDGSTITLNLTRSGDTVSAISVDYNTSDGTATAPGDYTADTNTLNFATGTTSQSVTIDIIDDNDVEPDEDFALTLSNVQLVSGSASVELGANAATTVTINDDDTATPADDDTNSSSDGFLGGLSPWWSVLMLTGWLRRRFGS